jgi:5-methylthioadenosine/S-adenosylhomocysteine deaminase
VGSIEPGKKADLIVVDLTGQTIPILNRPIRNIVPNLVYSADSAQVETVIVDGKIIMENRRILKIREDRIAQEAQKAAEQLADNATNDYEAAGLRLSRWSKEGII